MIAPAYFGIGIVIDYLRGRRGQQARAIRLRKTFEFLGGTFIKIGQQLALRVDILPYAYCEELTRLLDRMPAYSTAYAIRRIEAVSGKKMDEIFEAFDPEPIGSASVACVYQATLRRNGKKVAVKVRRPDIARKFAADLRALDWISVLLETLSVLRPGFTKNLRESLRQTLLEEIDFYKEARYQSLFRESAKKAKTKFVTAPKVYHKFSGADVIVMEFAEGIPLNELLTGLEQKDPAILNLLKRQNIKPKKLARRILWVNHAAMISELFFHSDPNPGNILVRPNSKLVFLDFGSCGSFTHAQRRCLKEINYYQMQGDPEGMARASIAMMEPLPPIDIDAFALELEALYRTSVYAVNSKHAEWWERTTAVQWFAFLKASMKFKVPLPPNILHMVRATLLYDTVASRLDEKTVFYDEFRRYERFAGKQARKRLKKKLRRTKRQGPDPTLYLRYEQMVDTGTRAVFRIQRFLDAPPLRFVALLSKSAYAIQAIFKTFALLGFVLFTTYVVLSLADSEYLHTATGAQMPFWQAIAKISSNVYFLLFGAVVAFINLRFIFFRVGDKGA